MDIVMRIGEQKKEGEEIEGKNDDNIDSGEALMKTKHHIDILD